MKAWLIFIGVVILAIAGALGWRAYYQTTPQYAVDQALRAVANRDYPRFTTYVDVDAVIQQQFQRHLGQTFGGTDAALSGNNPAEAFIQQLGEKAAPGMVAFYKEKVKACIGLRQCGEAPKANAVVYAPLGLTVADLDHLNDAVQLRPTDNTAAQQVTLLLINEAKPTHDIKAVLAKQADRWIIVDLVE